MMKHYAEALLRKRFTAPCENDLFHLTQLSLLDSGL